jgi:hypothetical protein
MFTHPCRTIDQLIGGNFRRLPIRECDERHAVPGNFDNPHRDLPIDCPPKRRLAFLKRASVVVPHILE